MIFFTYSQQLGYTEVPCTIVEYSDDDALVQLIAGNTQSENCPLDVGAAAFKYCKKGVNRHSENERYAEGVGYRQNTISVYRQAATVFKKVSDIGYFENSKVSDKDSLLSKTTNRLALFFRNGFEGAKLGFCRLAVQLVSSNL